MHPERITSDAQRAGVRGNQYVLNLNASWLDNKSAPIPTGTRPETERFLRRLGYRLVLKQLDHDATVAPGAHLALDTTWENTGVAPRYGDYRLAVRLAIAGRAVDSWYPMSEVGVLAR
jgi:Domain of unknown function (DUF4832)